MKSAAPHRARRADCHCIPSGDLVVSGLFRCAERGAGSSPAAERPAGCDEEETSLPLSRADAPPSSHGLATRHPGSRVSMPTARAGSRNTGRSSPRWTPLRGFRGEPRPPGSRPGRRTPRRATRRRGGSACCAATGCGRPVRRAQSRRERSADRPCGRRPGTGAPFRPDRDGVSCPRRTGRSGGWNAASVRVPACATRPGTRPLSSIPSQGGMPCRRFIHGRVSRCS